MTLDFASGAPANWIPDPIAVRRAERAVSAPPRSVDSWIDLTRIPIDRDGQRRDQEAAYAARQQEWEEGALRVPEGQRVAYLAGRRAAELERMVAPIPASVADEVARILDA